MLSCASIRQRGTRSSIGYEPKHRAQQDSLGLPNGVTRELLQPAPPAASTTSMENPNIGDVMLLVDRTGGVELTMTPQPADPTYDREPRAGANVITPATQAVAAPQQAFPTPPTPASAVHVQQEFFSAQSGTTGAEVQRVRWMSRFTEFLRSTATRGAQGVDRVLDGLGVPPLPQRAAAGSTRPVFSPPEELPAMSMVAPPVPGSWVSRQGVPEGAPLFGQAELMQMRRSQMEYPQLYGPQQRSEGGGSETSSRLQAEVQRQLEEYKAKQQVEVERLQQEIVMLREERDRDRGLRQQEAPDQ